MAAAVFFLLIFPLDMLTPHGLAVPILYVIPVMWFGIWSSPNAMVPAAVMGAVSTVLAVLGFAFYMFEETTSCDVMNRVLAIAVVWVSVLVILLRKGHEQELPQQ